MDFLIILLTAIFCFYYIINILLIFSAVLTIENELKAPVSKNLDLLPHVTIIIPAYNEEHDIVRTVRTILKQKYANFAIVVVNDGSKDDTLKKLISEFDLEQTQLKYKDYIKTRHIAAMYHNPFYARLRVLDKENGGKSDAINAGLNVATESEYVCVIDADVTLEQHALYHVVQPIVNDREGNVVATGGNIRIGIGSDVSNGEVHSLGTPSSLLVLLQILEYVRSFSLFRLGWNSSNAVPLLSGAFGVFKRDDIIHSGGYQKFSKGEDMEITLRLHERYLTRKEPYRIVQLVKPLCFTGAPSSLKELAGQRTRWQVGLLSGLKVYRHLVFRPRYGVLGMVALPYLLIFEAISPFLEIVGYLVLVVNFFTLHQSPVVLVWFLAAVIGGSLFVNLIAILTEALVMRLYTRPLDLLKLLAVGIIEPFGYHQLNQYWKIKATFQFYRNIHLKSTWQPPKRD
jgi:cellulose synthase/poly-beta-1,6-N-acetylglucosamine synthase-like glycosyltransferase